MKTDFNAFIGVWPYWENKYADPAGGGLVKLMDRNGIGRSVTVSLKAVFDDVKAGNLETFAACERYKGRLVPAVTVDPFSPENDAGYLRECYARGARVIKLYPVYHTYIAYLNGGGDLDRLMETGAGIGFAFCLPIRLLMNWGFAAIPAADAAAFADRYRECKLAIDNANYSELTAVTEAAKRNQNVYVGTASETMYNGIEFLIDAVGEDRVIGGTAAPLQYPACGIVKIEKAGISGAAKEKLLGGNCERLLGLCGGEFDDR